MFCPNCSQALQAQGVYKCPTCNFRFTSRKANKRNEGEREDPSQPEGEAPFGIDTTRVDAGVGLGVRLMILAIILLPVYKVIVYLYPATDMVIAGTRSVELIETGGFGILLTLFVGGILRALFALTVERRRAIKLGAEQN